MPRNDCFPQAPHGLHFGDTRPPRIVARTTVSRGRAFLISEASILSIICRDLTTVVQVLVHTVVFATNRCCVKSLVRYTVLVLYWFPCGTGVWGVGYTVWAGRALTLQLCGKACTELFA